MLKFLQINLHHSKAATAALLLRLSTTAEEIILIQEPWVIDDRICGLKIDGYDILYCKGKGRPRACILMKRTCNPLIMPNFSDCDTVSAALQLGSRTLWIASCYMAHDAGEPPPECLQAAVREAAGGRTPLIVGTDANAHHTIWGSTDINERGEQLLNFILGHNLVVGNRGAEPTFITSVRREVLDLTLANDKGSDLISSWRVLRDDSLSDHRYIGFVVDIPSPTGKPTRNKRKTDWDMYKQCFTRLLGDTSPTVPTTREELDQQVAELTHAFNEAMKASCPMRTFSGKPKPHWWSSEIAKLRKDCRQSFNLAKQTNDWKDYKSKLKTFKTAVRQNIRSNWCDYCSSIENAAEGNRLRKILASNPVPPAHLQKTDGTWTTTAQEMLGALVDAHFPGETGGRQRPVRTTSPLAVDPQVITRQKIGWAISSFQPYKSAGLDDIIPAELQAVSELVIPRLEAIYTGCLSLAYTPLRWREVRVVFIPKGGKISHTTAKDFRPLSLSSFLLKVLERLLGADIQKKLGARGISPSQHAYCKGRSVETALHSLVQKVEKSLHVKEYSLAAFLDIEGAFNNLLPSAITRALENRRLDTSTVYFIGHMLASREIVTEIAGHTLRRSVSRGTPQGGVLSSLIWNLVLDELLQKLEKLGCKIVAYADDLALIASGKFPEILAQLIQSALNELVKWSKGSGLGVNPAKSELILFTRRHKIPFFKLPEIGGQPLKLKESARYLGLILDRKLLWRENIEERVRKATVALYTCRKAIGKRWGMQPRVVYWLYTAVVRPILMYGSLVWWPALEKKVNRDRVGRVQRLACLLTTGCLRSTPTKALETILHLIPLDLFSRELAASAALRLNAINPWTETHYGHSKILQEIEEDVGSLSTDYVGPEPSPMFNRAGLSLEIPSREDWAMCLVEPRGVTIYTDGSKLAGRVGGGIYSENPRLNTSFRLPDHCSVYQAEVIAIHEAANYLLQNEAQYREISILSDSQAAIKSLNSVYLTSRVATSCRSALNELATRCKVNLVWVPGHRDIPGNCMADELAKAGSALPEASIKLTPGVPLATQRLLLHKAITRLANARWLSENTCISSRQIWPQLDRRRTKDILSLPRRSVSSLIGAITGHWLGGTHAERMGIINRNDFCRSCRDEEEVETMVHLFCQCPALSRKRFLILGRPELDDLSDLRSVSIRDLMLFIKNSNWFSLQG